MPDTVPVWDYVIVGAGSSGCVLANRLTENPSVRVLLLEAGPKDDNFWIHIPVGFNKFLNHTRCNWCFATEPEDNGAAGQFRSREAKLWVDRAR